MLEARPPAKINLTLEVGPRAADGYHPLRSIFMRIGLTDRLVLRPTDGVRDMLTVGGLTGAPVDDNLVLRSLGLLRARSPGTLPALAATLDKRIPVAAGLAGGSADAAAALDLAADAWGLALAPEQRHVLAAELGSDVPFFALGSPVALVEGRGERLTPLPGLIGAAGVLLCCPPRGVSTAAAFDRFDTQTQGPRATPTDELAADLQRGLDGPGLARWAPRLRDANALWPAASALMPGLAELRDALEQRTGLAWLMSGSGSTLFSLHPSAAAATATGMAVAQQVASLPLPGTLLLATDLVGPDPVWRNQ